MTLGFIISKMQKQRSWLINLICLIGWKWPIRLIRSQVQSLKCLSLDLCQTLPNLVNVWCRHVLILLLVQNDAIFYPRSVLVLCHLVVNGFRSREPLVVDCCALRKTTSGITRAWKNYEFLRNCFVFHLWNNPLSLLKTHRPRSFQHSPVFSACHLWNDNVWDLYLRLSHLVSRFRKTPCCP